MSKRVVIVGAGGFGRGVLSWIQQSPRHLVDHSVNEVVFLDDAPSERQLEAPVVGTVRDYVPDICDEVLVAVGVPRVRRQIVKTLEDREVQFHTFVDDRAVIAKSVRIGTGAIICPGTVISAHANVGPHVHINFNCSVGHDVVLGPFTTLSPSSNIMGETRLGSEVFVGGSAVVLPRIEIIDRATIGAGATVTRDVKTDMTVVGNPARGTG